MQATIWHYILALPILIVLGSLVHWFRSWPNFMPDRYDLDPANPVMNYKLNDMLSLNYGFWDYVVGTDYDEEGFYVFLSSRNWRNMCLWTVVLGYAALLSFPELMDTYVSIVNRSPSWLWELLKKRMANLSLL